MSRILLLFVSILLSPSVFAESSHASLFVKTVEKFSIFPEEQPNNAVYRDGKLLLKSPSVQWLDLIQIKDTESWLVSGIDEEGKYNGHLLLNEKDKLAMTNQGYGVYDILKEEINLATITAVVIGGTSLFGGRGSIPGSVLGALIVGVFTTGLSLAGVDDYWQMFAVGNLVLIAVALDQWLRRASQ